MGKSRTPRTPLSAPHLGSPLHKCLPNTSRGPEQTTCHKSPNAPSSYVQSKHLREEARQKQPSINWPPSPRPFISPLSWVSRVHGALIRQPAGYVGFGKEKYLNYLRVRKDKQNLTKHRMLSILPEQFSHTCYVPTHAALHLNLSVLISTPGKKQTAFLSHLKQDSKATSSELRESELSPAAPRGRSPLSAGWSQKLRG